MPTSQHGTHEEADEDCSEARKEGPESEEAGPETDEVGSHGSASSRYDSIAQIELWLEGFFQEDTIREISEMLRCALALNSWLAESCRAVHSHQD
jgi:hypothetical protein